MRSFILLLIGGLAIAALAAPAHAALIKMNLTDFDVGALYNVPTGSTWTGAATLDALPQTSVVGLGVPAAAANINGSLSDTMGIFRIESIIDVASGNVLFSSGGAAEISGIFWGLTDTYLATSPSGSVAGGQDQDIRGTGVQVALFYNASHVWPGSGAPGPAGFAVGPVGTDGKSKLTFAPITNGTLFWTFRSTTGFNLGDLANEFFAKFTATASGNAFGSEGNFLADMGAVDGWGSGFNNDALDTEALLGYQLGDILGFPTKPVDTAWHFTGSPNGAGSWLLLTSDPVTADLVPEPVTMAGLLLGVGCLTRYIRKRR